MSRGVDLQSEVGVGLRPSHYAHVLEQATKVDWFEVLSENYVGLDKGLASRPLSYLEKIRANYPLVMHGVSLSIGSMDELNWKYLDQIKELAAQIEAAWVSDHLCWTGVGGRNLHDLLPLPCTEEALFHVVERVKRVQDYLGQRIALENPSSYIEFSHSSMSEAEFLGEIAGRSDCDILLDVNNVYVSCRNHGWDAMKYFEQIPVNRVRQFHLAGHQDYGTHCIDTHNTKVCDEVWQLYQVALRRFGSVPTLIEWDADLPEFSVLEAECVKAKKLMEESMKENQDAQPLFTRAPSVDAPNHLRS